MRPLGTTLTGHARGSVPILATLLLAGFLSGACTLMPASDAVLHARALEDWRDMRFGMFIHWGPVSVTGKEIGWSRGTEIPRREYDVLPTRFDPTHFDAGEWARLAKEAGCKYVVLTAKHHDGFCLWDSEVTDHDVMNTPFGRDVVAELAAACAREGLAFGLYYSILDWYQPDYNAAGTYGGPGYPLPPAHAPSMERYQEYMHAQLRELSVGYGPLLTFWFDGEWEDPWTYERGARLAAFCRQLSPTTLLNNRVGKAREGMAGTTAQASGNPGDYDTPEQRVGSFNNRRPWETCMTLGTQWSWKPEDELKPLAECVRTLVMTAGGDGNLLLNVGPMPDGRVGARQVERLREVGAWLRGHGASIYGTRGGPFYPGAWGASTHRGDRVYVHVFEWEDEVRVLPGLRQRILSASLLGGGDVPFTQTDALVKLYVPAAHRDPVDTVVVLRLASPVAGMAKWKRVPSSFDLGGYGEWLSEHATFTLSSRADKWSANEAMLLAEEDFPGHYAIHTQEEEDPFLTIDLGAVHKLRGIEIENRCHSLEERAAGLTASISCDGETWTEIWRAPDVRPRWIVVVDPPATEARWVRLGLHTSGGTYLHLRHVRIFGDR